MNLLIPENVIRRIDNLGRITLPKGLRDRFFLGDNAELEIYTARLDNRNCIVFSKPIEEEEEINAAIEILARHGIEVNMDGNSISDTDD